MHYEEIEREWDEAEEPKEKLPEDEDEYRPVTPYSKKEQQRIMGDLKRSLTYAQEQGDVARTFYTLDALKALQ